MSLILDALGRSQKEQAGPLDVLHSEPQNTVRAIAVPLPWLLFIAAMVIGGFLWLDNRQATQESVAPALSHDTPVRAPVQRAEPVKATDKPITPLEPDSTTEKALVSDKAKPRAPSAAVAALYERSSRDAEQVASATGRADVENNATRSTQQAEVTTAPAAEATDNKEAPLDVDALLAKAQAELKQRGAPAHSAPWLSELSQRQRDAVPTLYYARHDYSTVKDQRRVMLNSSVVGEGRSVPGTAVQVEQILPDSVVLHYNGVSFRLKALNSWVNL